MPCFAGGHLCHERTGATQQDPEEQHRRERTLPQDATSSEPSRAGGIEPRQRGKDKSVDAAAATFFLMSGLVTATL